ncbi:hypothetical protein HOT99_gp191 [Caulobacter phage CcrBL10]|uniref:Uncharacterized protein n=1 Tax=Caulobacter phage CcrBL10 TaxID=2283269 RepID=A0A385E9M0_9CAUD|nr:hypothetical protein HOT99_gp191 [Caulobacter phage CcrBL10]AXQ68426.1 hypothetical protein CcrBL10_gp222 [Caulobacter phage CcrBL10]
MRYVLEYMDCDDQIVQVDFEAATRASAIAKAKRLFVKAVEASGRSIFTGYMFEDHSITMKVKLVPFGTLSRYLGLGKVTVANIAFDDRDAKIARQDMAA